ncbi:Uncharacterised protein [Dermacoccus nishinomiyaensis]|uniref:DUF4396 domain-containing protein n=2 Tax=Dermacoccus nishinomiyaensis TaxID=1274 RepID=UPI000E02EE9A|nr:DUF4396 domain-containing protein [Dermacoccus nishinomiyaensis]STD20279.1 Uncharacterised protein [Dermacoccus nishinomiyaensis]STD71433.1 Uncharacterised protein [Dermacoccus nishinomiyaensis]
MILDGVMLLWFIQVAIAVAFVAVDIHTTPEATVMKWGFVIITAFSGLFGALLYVLSCREPLPGTHELYVAAKWRQVVGSTMHCVAGDGIGILAAAVITSRLGLPMWADVLCEYALGFIFGWTVFQALFMKSMFSSYRRSLTGTFMSELLSMNTVMGGMTAVMVPWMTHNMDAMSPTGPTFWFVISISLCAGFVVALPMNWWLVDHGLKHGMMTVRPDGTPVPQAAAVAAASAALSGYRLVPATTPPAETPHQAMPDRPSRGKLASMTLVSFLVFAAGFLIAGLLGTLTMTR